MKCLECGSENTAESDFCEECGNPLRKNTNKNTIKTQYAREKENKLDSNFCEKEKNMIQKMNDRINLLAILLGFFVSIIVLCFSSVVYSSLLSNNFINFFTYSLLVIITMIFFGGLTIGITGCSNYDDAQSNSIAFLLIIIDFVGILLGFGFSLTMGIGGLFSSIFPFSSTNTTTSSLMNTDSSTSIQFILLIIILLCSIIISGITGCYLGVFLKKNIELN